MELNMGFRNTLVMVNTHRIEDGRQLVGHNAVMNIFDRRAPRVDIISKIPQGNVNHDAWRIARKNQMKQFLVMLSDLTDEDLMKKHPEGISVQYDTKQLTRLSRNQVIFYDETHLEQEGGGGSTTTIDYQIRFPRDSDGWYAPLSPSNLDSIYADRVTKTSFKYAR